MPGFPNLAEHAYGSSYGYSMPAYDPENPYGAGEVSHTGFVLWLIAFLLVAVAILGGLKVGGFSFVFRSR